MDDEKCVNTMEEGEEEDRKKIALPLASLS